MSTRVPRRSHVEGVRLLPWVLTAAVVAVACSGPRGTPAARFSAALSDLFSGSFAFEITLEADRTTLNDLGEGAQAAADFLQGLRIAGVVDASESAALHVSALGIDDLTEVVIMGTDALYLRASLDALSVAAATEPLDVGALTARLTEAGIDDGVVRAARTFAEGDWIGLTGLEADVEDDATSAPGFDLDQARGAIVDSFGPGLEGFVERFLTLEETAADDATRWDVTLDVAALVTASQGLNAQLGLGGVVPTEAAIDDLGGLPTAVPGVVVVRDGVLDEIVFDVAAAAADAGTDVAGTILVRVAFDDDPAAVVPPPDAEVVTLAQVNDAVADFVAWQAREALRQLEESLSDLEGQLEEPTDAG